MAIPAVIAEAMSLEAELAAIDEASLALWSEIGPAVDVAGLVTRGEAAISELSMSAEAYGVRQAALQGRTQALMENILNMADKIGRGEYPETAETLGEARAILDRVWANIIREESGTSPWLGRILDKINAAKAAIAAAQSIYYHMLDIQGRVQYVIWRGQVMLDNLSGLLDRARDMERLAPSDAIAVAEDIEVTLRWMSDDIDDVLVRFQAAEEEIIENWDYYYGFTMPYEVPAAIDRAWGFVSDIFSRIAAIIPVID